MDAAHFKLTPGQFDYGINLGLQPCELLELEFNSTSKRDDYLTIFVDRAKEWNATHHKKDTMARGTLLQFLAANGIKLDNDNECWALPGALGRRSESWSASRARVRPLSC
jgi:hypothetical protein